jgi:hypothetical protein
LLPVLRPFNAAGFYFGKVASKEIVCMFTEGRSAADDSIRALSVEEARSPLEIVLL